MPYKDIHSPEAIACRKRAYNKWYDKMHNDPEFKRRNDERYLKYYYNHYDEINLNRKLLRDKDRNEILELLGERCIICNYDGVAIQIDHIKGNGCKHKKLTRSAYYKLILAEIKNGSKDYQLLCATHNIEKKFKNHEGVKIWD